MAAPRPGARHGRARRPAGRRPRLRARARASCPRRARCSRVVRDRTEELRREIAEREFVSNAAHELRNPIAGISGAIEVLRAGAKDDPEAREHFLAPAVRGRRAGQPPDRVAADPGAHGGGGRGRRPRRSTCASSIEEAAQAVAPPDGRRGRRSTSSRSSRREGDRVLLRQVLIGLLTNAFKNTPAPGAVTLRAARARTDEVLIEVEDTGNGIARRGGRSRVRALLPGLQAAGAGGLRPRPVDRQAHGGRDGWRDRRRIRAGRRQHVLGAPSGRAARGPTPVA